MNYNDFINSKTHKAADHGIDPTWMPDGLFDFQQFVSEYAIRRGRCAVFLDTGLGKTIIELTTAVNYRKYTGKPVLVLTPLAVAFQFLSEASKFGIELKESYYKQAIMNLKDVHQRFADDKEPELSFNDVPEVADPDAR